MSSSLILDVNLPDTLGYDLCEQMQNYNDVYIIILTSRNGIEDKKIGFCKGADDYLTKPFDIQELELRVQAILKRRRFVNDTVERLVFGDLIIDPKSREVTINQKKLGLTFLEFNLLYSLASDPGRVWTRKELMQKVWDDTEQTDTRVIDVHIGQIRKKIESTSSNLVFIQTIRGVGYRFDVP